MSEIKTGSDQIPNFGNMPLESKGDLSLEEAMGALGVSTPVTPKEKDTIEKSGHSRAKKTSAVPTPSHPDIPAPNQEIVKKYMDQAIKEIQMNPWFKPSFLVAFTNAINELLKTQTKMHFNEAQNELTVRQQLLDLAKTAAEAAKELMLNQAEEQMVQAMASFANAAVSGAQLLQSTRNLGSATNKIDKEIQEQQDTVGTLVLKRDGQEPLDPTKPNYKPPRLQVLTEDLNAVDATKPPETKDLTDARAQLDKLKANRDIKIQEQMRNLDYQTQYLGETLKQTITGTSSVWTSLIKTESAELEGLQKMTEGFIQAYNKFSETISKDRDQSAADFNKFLDDMKRIIESSFKAHSLSGKA